MSLWEKNKRLPCNIPSTPVCVTMPVETIAPTKANEPRSRNTSDAGEDAVKVVSALEITDQLESQAICPIYTRAIVDSSDTEAGFGSLRESDDSFVRLQRTAKNRREETILARHCTGPDCTD